MLIELTSAVIFTLSSLFPPQPHPNQAAVAAVPNNELVAQVNYSLEDRYTNTYVNNVFVDNILLTLAYMNGNVKPGDLIDWDYIHQIKEFSLTIQPHQIFAFHDKVLDKYKNSNMVTTNAHFIRSEGFKSDGYLVGDGVCHLASFMKVAAEQAGLPVEAPTNHNFADIAEVDKIDGVAIYYSETGSNTQKENLYITNPYDQAMKFIFTHENDALTIHVEKII